MNFTCHHWRCDDEFHEAERGGEKQPKLVESIQDFIDGAVFYVSFRGSEWYPSHLNYSGHVLTLELDVSKVYICSTFKEYAGMTINDFSSGYNVYKPSKAALKLAKKGYELIVRGDRLDEISEGIVLDPKKSIKSISIERVQLNTKAIIDSIFNNRVIPEKINKRSNKGFDFGFNMDEIIKEFDKIFKGKLDELEQSNTGVFFEQEQDEDIALL